MVDEGALICAATKLPVIGDGDTGYGNAMNCKRTVRLGIEAHLASVLTVCSTQVRGYAQAGFAGVLIEDQVAPKQCGHMRTRQVSTKPQISCASKAVHLGVLAGRLTRRGSGARSRRVRCA